MFCISLAAIAALGVIAGGAFWTAQSVYRVTDNQNAVDVRFCSCSADACDGTPIEWQIAGGAINTTINCCPTNAC